ncbi:unnamed protein product [Closterium sp. NIES-53]
MAEHIDVTSLTQERLNELLQQLHESSESTGWSYRSGVVIHHERVFDANYVSKDTVKIRYAVSLLRGPAMDWWRVIVTKATDYATLPTQEGQTGPWAPSHIVEMPQYRTRDAWSACLRA